MRIARVVVFVIERGKDGAASAAEEEVGTARAAAARSARAARVTGGRVGERTVGHTRRPE
jgi:hypothetical protein